MKTIILKTLTLINFKGIKSLTIDFGKETMVRGANGTGKTTIADAISWLLFGKDSTDRTNFEIKTLDSKNNVIPKIDHEVSAVILVDGESMELRRTFREKWVKKRGSLDSEFAGNESLYEWNGVPLTLRDYTVKINEIVEESVFKLITSPSAFNSLNWQDQRKVLIDISGGVTDEDVAKGNKEFEKLLTKLTNKSLEEYQKQIASSIRKSKDEIKMIPTRIDEVDRGKPEAIDFSKVEKELAAKKDSLTKIDLQISDKVAAQQEILNKRQEIQRNIYSLKSELQEIEFKARQEAQRQIRQESSAVENLQLQLKEKKEALQKAERTMAHFRDVLKTEQGDIELLEQKNNHIREEWNKRNAETFQMEEDSCKCPTCQREFEAEDIEAKKKELFANFQNAKMKDLEELSAKGKRNKENIEAGKTEIEVLKGRISKGEEVLEDLNGQLDKVKSSLKDEEGKTEVKSESEVIAELLKDNTSYKSKWEKIDELEESLQKEDAVDMEDLKDKKTSITAEINELNLSLQAKDQIKKANERIEALQKEESQLAQQIADYEKDQYTIEQFTKAKIEKLEGLINDRFLFVKFKLFETQVNGGEVPTCKSLVNGVPFSDANTASKINAGIDIINTLNEYYGVSAPIVIDNRESVTEILPCKSQIINLIVDPSKKKLDVMVPELAEAV